MTKKITVYGLLFCFLILQTSCMQGNTKTAPSEMLLKTQSATCDELLHDKNNLALLTKKNTKACIKLHKAIEISTPGNDYQSDSKALVLLKDLKQSKILSEHDQKFNNLLLQHVSQRQKLRQIINAQKTNLKKIKVQNTVLHNQLDTLQSQLNQLKTIEVEIDKKERSVTSPIGE